MKVLLYHRVAPYREVGPMTVHSAVEPDVFERQMRLIKKKVVPFEESVEEGFDRSRNVISVTFDDGYVDNFVYAFPILKRYAIPATIFLSTENIDNRIDFWWDKLDFLVAKSSHKRIEYDGLHYDLITENQKRGAYRALFRVVASQEQHLDTVIRNLEEKLNGMSAPEPCLLMTWDHVKEMSRSGIAFGSHTCSHKRLSMIGDPYVLKTELQQSKKRLHEIIGSKGFGFAYPYGRETDYGADSISAVHREGYQYACTAVAKEFENTDSTYEIPRIGVSRRDTEVTFRLKTETPYPQLYHRVRRILGKHKTRSWE
jgi:peptidoglycan/xylan/chitin deacetylase (PgdA/CDA1 family)